MTDTYRTPVDAAVNDYDLFALPSGKRVTVCPLGDDRTTLRARMPRTDAIAALARMGMRLPSLETVKEIARVGHRIEPVTLVYDAATAAKMRTRAFCERHDDEVTRQLLATKWDGRTVVMNFGKWHIDGAAPGNNRLAGWSRKDGSFIQAGVSDNHIGEAASLFDYGTLVMGEVDDEAKKPTGGHDLPPRPLGLRVVDVAKSYLGVTEKPGAAHHPDIQRFLAAARRGGTSTAGMFDDRSGAQTLGSRPADETEWCISYATTCIAEALLPGDYAPCGRRAACWEAVADAKARGRWHDVRSGYVPQDGDLELEGRNGQDPRIPGHQGHVGVRVGAQRIDGNSANTVRYVLAGGPKVVGWIQVSRMQ